MELRVVRKNLLAQHETLRGLMKDLEVALRAKADARALLKGVRDALVAHNAAEEGVLVPILSTIDAWGAERVEEMLGEHREEHELLVRRLDLASSVELLLATLGALREHMAHEEATMLSDALLKDDVVNVDAD